MSEMLIIGIAGGSGSGKSTISQAIKNMFGDNITIINHDNYYKRQVGRTYDERAKVNYDCPDAFDTDLMAEHIQALKRGETILCPVYDYTIHNRSDETIEIKPTSVLIIDGILILAEESLRSLMDIKIFVDTPDDIRILRRIRRDVNERARSLDSVIDQYLTTVRPMHELYVGPSRKYADIIVPEGGKNMVAMEMIQNRVMNHINSQSLL